MYVADLGKPSSIRSRQSTFLNAKLLCMNRCRLTPFAKRWEYRRTPKHLRGSLCGSLVVFARKGCVRVEISPFCDEEAIAYVHFENDAN